MNKRLSLVAAALVVFIVAVQLVMHGRRQPIEAPPRLELPAVDRPPVSAPPSAELASPAPRQEVASPDPPPPVDDVPSPAGSSPDGLRSFVFECDNGVSFALRVVPGEAMLFSWQVLGSDVLTLPQTETESGVRYASGDAVVWNRGGVATFLVRGQSYADCRSNQARGGISFRALGHEPSWQLEIAPELELIVLTTELGERRTDFPYREPTVAGKRTTYRAFVGTQELFAVVDNVPCNDTMSGEAFAMTVAVTFEGATLYGCGGFPWNRVRVRP